MKNVFIKKGTKKRFLQKSVFVLKKVLVLFLNSFFKNVVNKFVCKMLSYKTFLLSFSRNNVFIEKIFVYNFFISKMCKNLFYVKRFR